MTNRNEAPVLDRLIRRVVSVEVEVPATTAYTYDAEELTPGNRIDDGEWRRDSDTELAIGLNDSNGLEFPDDLTLPISGVEVAFDGAAATTLTLTALEILRIPGQGVPIGVALTFDGPLPAAGTALTVGIDSGVSMTVTQTTERNTWAARRDYRGRDFLSASDIGRFPVTSTRFIVRAESGPWAILDRFTDDKGETQEVQGIGEVAGRGRYLELLTQT